MSSPSVTRLDDDALARAAGRGQEPAFAEIVRRHDGRVRRVCRSVLRDGASADDAAQEAWIRAWRAIGRFDGGSLAAWLSTIARREALRVAGRAAAAATPSERLPERADPRAEPYARVRGHELARGLARAMAELPPTYREAARRDLSGESPSATAAALGLRPVTARVRAHRARKMLVERMSDLDLAA